MPGQTINACTDASEKISQQKPRRSRQKTRWNKVEVDFQFAKKGTNGEGGIVKEKKAHEKHTVGPNVRSLDHGDEGKMVAHLTVEEELRALSKESRSTT